MSKPISRRQFVYGSAIAAASIGMAGLVGCGSGSETAAPESDAASTEETTPEAEATSSEVGEVVVRLAGLKGPTSMGLVKMFDDAENGLTKNKYECQVGANADELTPLILQGELDILAVPANLGAILYNNSDKSVQMLAANMLGAIYVIENGDTISSIEDLAGRTIYTVGKGSTPEYLLNYLLAQHGLTMGEDGIVEFRGDPTEVVGLRGAGTADVIMLPQPIVTVCLGQIEDSRIALDMNEEWNALDNGSVLVTAGLIINRAFAEAHPEVVATTIEECKESTDWCNANVDEAAVLIEKYDIVAEPIAKASMPLCNVVFITGEEMKTATQAYFQVLYDQDPAAVGGAMPEDDFYYEA